MALAKQFDELQIWQLARILAGEIYRTSSSGRVSKDFGFRDQIQRAAVSVMSNIAEGFERRSKKDFAHFLTIALGSLAEVKSLCYLAANLACLSVDIQSGLVQQCDRLRAAISAMLKSLRSRR